MQLEILDVNFTAKEMADAISSVASILYENSIITDEGYTSLLRAIADVKSYKSRKKWEVSIGRDYPVRFNRAENIIKETNDALIILSSKNISVDLEKDFPFNSLDICLVINNAANGELISRWHFDLANGQDDGIQPGPLTHVQYGGHNASSLREFDHPLKVPRWCHPPMDIILLCEAIVANFFPHKWDKIKEYPAWKSAVVKSQRVCYSAYLTKMVQTLGISSTTILHEMDAKIWSGNLGP